MKSLKTVCCERERGMKCGNGIMCEHEWAMCERASGKCVMFFISLCH